MGFVVALRSMEKYRFEYSSVVSSVLGETFKQNSELVSLVYIKSFM